MACRMNVYNANALTDNSCDANQVLFRILPVTAQARIEESGAEVAEETREEFVAETAAEAFAARQANNCDCGCAYNSRNVCCAAVRRQNSRCGESFC